MEVGNVKLNIDGRWDLTELSLLTRVYTQIYGLLYSLEVADDYLEEEIMYIYSKYPWTGGYSAVNFYKNLFYKIPFRHRPAIKSIQYNSPGFIELTELVSVASDLAQIVVYVCAAVFAGNRTYNSIQKGISDRKLSKINLKSEELKLVEQESAFIRKSIKELSQVMGIKQKILATLYRRAENNELAILKILSSLYRRARDLAKLSNKQKLSLEDPRKKSK
jgi:hypothetical protein